MFLYILFSNTGKTMQYSFKSWATLYGTSTADISGIKSHTAAVFFSVKKWSHYFYLCTCFIVFDANKDGNIINLCAKLPLVQAGSVDNILKLVSVCSCPNHQE